MHQPFLVTFSFSRIKESKLERPTRKRGTMSTDRIREVANQLRVSTEALAALVTGLEKNSQEWKRVAMVVEVVVKLEAVKKKPIILALS
jgi:hypothetical protein